MKICLACGQPYAGTGWQCPCCGHVVDVVGGFPAFSLQAADNSKSFDPAYYAELERLEAGNFWFRARNRLVVSMLSRYFPQARRLLEIGCGTGFVLSGIAQACPELELAGSEPLPDGLPFAARRAPNAALFQMDARAIPFAEEFDVIGAFDVLEHIEDDELALAQMYRATRPGGGIILTVPQHMFLWSAQDKHACHVRRYRAADLRDKVLRAGFEVERTASFVSLLLPLMFVVRRFARKAVGEFDALAELRIGRFANAILHRVLAFEVVLTSLGISFKMGGSLLMVARKGVS